MLARSFLPLAAYREDLLRTPGREPSPVDPVLLRVGTLLHRCEQLRGTECPVEEIEPIRRECVAFLHRALSLMHDTADAALLPSSDEGVVASIREVADFAEETGLLRFADSLLLLTYREFALDGGMLERGRVVVQRARIARKTGDTEAASVLYETVLDWGRRDGLPELVARAELGLGLLAVARGNFPLVRAHFQATLSAATEAAATDLIQEAHYGLMAAYAKAKDFENAVIHGWQAFRGAATAIARRAALLNVGQIILEYGAPDVALLAVDAALSSSLPRRLALPALGTRALAAAAIGNGAVLRQTVERLDALAGGSDFRYESAAALTDAVEALHAANDASVESRRVAVLTVARDAAFHELVHRLETVGEARIVTKRSSPTPAPVRLVFDEVERLGQLPELQSAL